MTLKWYPAGYAMGACTGLYSYANLFDQNNASRTKLDAAINHTVSASYANGKTSVSITNVNEQPVFIKFKK